MSFHDPLENGRRAGRDFDYSALSGRVRLRARLKAIAANNVTVIGATMAFLTTFISLAVLVILVALGNPDGGALACSVLFLGGGSCAMFDVLYGSGDASSFGDFARANGLEPISGVTATHYAGRLFADGSHLVMHAARTRDEAFVEVGDRFPTTAPTSTEDANEPELYFRARLSGKATSLRRWESWVPLELDERLATFAGPYEVETYRDELTLYGTRRLAVREPGRVQEAFALVGTLAALADDVLVRPQATAPKAGGVEQTSSGIPRPATGREPVPTGRPLSAVWVVIWTLALLIVCTAAFAVGGAMLGDSLRGNEAGATLLVGLVSTVIVAAIGFFIRRA